MKRFPLLFAALFSLLAIGMTFVGFTIIPAIIITVTTVVYCVAYRFYYFPVTACIWAAGIYFIFGFNLWAALCFCSLTLPLALVMAVCFRKQTDLATLLVSSSLVQTAFSAFWIYYYTKQNGKSMAELITAPMVEAAKQLDETYAVQIEEIITPMLDLIFPSMLIITVVFLVYAVFVLSRAFLKKNGLIYENMPAFDELHMNKSQAVVFMSIFLLSLFMGIYSPVLYNVMTIVSTLLMICGLSVVCFYLKKFGVGTPLKIFICFLLLTVFSTLASPALFILGIWDSFRPLRKDFFVI